MPTSPILNAKDSWIWKPDPIKKFTVKSCYEVLLGMQNFAPYDQLFCRASKLVWLCDIPSKISFFVWRLLQNRLPTKELLWQKGILVVPNDTTCVLCKREVESVVHLFFNCAFSYNVWMAVNFWTGAVGPLQNDGVNHFLQFAGWVRGKRNRKWRHVIWMAAVWVLWITRNNIIFKDGTANLIDVVADIKILSWKWFTNRNGSNSGTLYSDWCFNPMECLTGG